MPRWSSALVFIGCATAKLDAGPSSQWLDEARWAVEGLVAAAPSPPASAAEEPSEPPFEEALGCLARTGGYDPACALNLATNLELLADVSGAARALWLKRAIVDAMARQDLDTKTATAELLGSAWLDLAVGLSSSAVAAQRRDLLQHHSETTPQAAAESLLEAGLRAAECAFQYDPLLDFRRHTLQRSALPSWGNQSTTRRGSAARQRRLFDARRAVYGPGPLLRDLDPAACSSVLNVMDALLFPLNNDAPSLDLWLFERGIQFAAQGDGDAALAALLAAVACQPDMAGAWYNAAVVLRDAGFHRSALWSSLLATQSVVSHATNLENNATSSTGTGGVQTMDPASIHLASAVFRNAGVHLLEAVRADGTLNTPIEVLAAVGQSYVASRALSRALATVGAPDSDAESLTPEIENLKRLAGPLGRLKRSATPPASPLAPVPSPHALYVTFEVCFGLVNQQISIASALELATRLADELQQSTPEMEVILVLPSVASRKAFEPFWNKDSFMPPVVMSEWYDIDAMVHSVRHTLARFPMRSGSAAASFWVADALPEDVLARAEQSGAVADLWLGGAELGSKDLVTRLLPLVDPALGDDTAQVVRLGCLLNAISPESDEEAARLQAHQASLELSPRLATVAARLQNKLEAKATVQAKERGAIRGRWHAVHMRIEDDLPMQAPSGSTAPEADAQALTEVLWRRLAEQATELIHASGARRGDLVYIASGASARATELLSPTLVDQLGLVLVTKEELAADEPPVGRALMPEEEALVDFWLCSHSAVFLGDSRSSFSLALFARRGWEDPAAGQVSFTGGKGFKTGDLYRGTGFLRRESLFNQPRLFAMMGSAISFPFCHQLAAEPDQDDTAKTWPWRSAVAACEHTMASQLYPLGALRVQHHHLALAELAQHAAARSPAAVLAQQSAQWSLAYSVKGQAAMQQWSAALRLLLVATHWRPRHAGVYQVLGEALEQHGFKRTAAHMYRQAIAAQPMCAQSLSRLSELQRDKAAPCTDVVATLLPAVELFPAKEPLRWQLTKAMRHTGCAQADLPRARVLANQPLPPGDELVRPQLCTALTLLQLGRLSVATVRAEWPLVCKHVDAKVAETTGSTLPVGFAHPLGVVDWPEVRLEMSVIREGLWFQMNRLAAHRLNATFGSLPRPIPSAPTAETAMVEVKSDTGFADEVFGEPLTPHATDRPAPVNRATVSHRRRVSATRSKPASPGVSSSPWLLRDEAMQLTVLGVLSLLDLHLPGAEVEPVPDGMAHVLLLFRRALGLLHVAHAEGRDDVRVHLAASIATNGLGIALYNLDNVYASVGFLCGAGQPGNDVELAAMEAHRRANCEIAAKRLKMAEAAAAAATPRATVPGRA